MHLWSGGGSRSITQVHCHSGEPLVQFRGWTILQGEGGVWKVISDKESVILKSERRVSVVKAMSAWLTLLGRRWKELEPARESSWLKHESDRNVGQ